MEGKVVRIFRNYLFAMNLEKAKIPTIPANNNKLLEAVCVENNSSINSLTTNDIPASITLVMLLSFPERKLLAAMYSSRRTKISKEETIVSVIKSIKSNCNI